MSDQYNWNNFSQVGRKTYLCGYCGDKVGPDRAYFGSTPGGRTVFIYICPSCTQPTFIDVDGNVTPAPRLGRDVKGITDAGVETLYNEARDCTAVGAYTASVLLCRKILMNLAVQHGAKEGESFLDYVDYLEKTGYVPPNGKEWVDLIRKKGNEATHEIALMTQADAAQILHFSEMLLRFVYEFPAMIEGIDA
jgi:hypothetical protein